MLMGKTNPTQETCFQLTAQDFKTEMGFSKNEKYIEWVMEYHLPMKHILPNNLSIDIKNIN